MSNTRLEPKLYIADWMSRREGEEVNEQANRIANQVRAALAENPDLKIGLLYSANQDQADFLNVHYARNHGGAVPERILLNGKGQAELFQAFIKHINGRWTAAERARVRIVSIPTSLHGGEDKEGNRLTEDEIKKVINHVFNLMNVGEQKYAIFGMKREGIFGFDEFNIGGGVSKNWIEKENTLTGRTQDEFFQMEMRRRQPLIERAPEFYREASQYRSPVVGITLAEVAAAHKASGKTVMSVEPVKSEAGVTIARIFKETKEAETSKKSFFQRHPRVALGLAITAIGLAVALAVVATIATCGAAGVPLGFLGVGIVAAGTTTIAGGFSVFAAVAGGGFLLAAFATVGGALGVHRARKEIEMKKLAEKPALLAAQTDEPEVRRVNIGGGTHGAVNKDMKANPGRNRDNSAPAPAPAEASPRDASPSLPDPAAKPEAEDTPRPKRPS